MIYDVRIYDLKPGMLDKYMSAVREVGLAVREDAGVKLAGWYYTEIGTLNQVIHIWAYEGMDDMESKTKAVRDDPRWLGEYVPRVLPLIANQRNQIMNAPDFFPRPG